MVDTTNTSSNAPVFGYYMNKEEREKAEQRAYEQYVEEMKTERLIKKITALVASVLKAQDNMYFKNELNGKKKNQSNARVNQAQNQQNNAQQTPNAQQVHENKDCGVDEELLVDDSKYLDDTTELLRKARKFCADSIDDMPLNYMVDYIKEADDREDGVSEARLNREIIWCFKHDSDDYPVSSYRLIKDMIVSAFARQLYRCFGSDISNVTLLPVPCSSFVNHASRWCLPLQEICDTLERRAQCSPLNGYPSIIYTLDSKPEHFNKGHITYPQVEFGKELRGANIVLLDDVSCSGNHIRWCKKQLEALGAHVVAVFVIGKTKQK